MLFNCNETLVCIQIYIWRGDTLVLVLLYCTSAIGGSWGVQGVRTHFFSKILGIDFYSGFRRNAQYRLLQWLKEKNSRGGGAIRNPKKNQV